MKKTINFPLQIKNKVKQVEICCPMQIIDEFMIYEII